jgi:UTP--glucose-1-phosphate uridylyltransferase
VKPEDVSKYGIVSYDQQEKKADSVYKVKDLVEKPKREDAPSNTAILGRYILRPEIFDILAKLQPGSGGEIQLTDALKELAHKEEVTAYHFIGKRYDVGDKLGFIQATIDFAMDNDELREDILQYIKNKVAKS